VTDAGFVTLAHGGSSRIVEPRRTVARTDAEWRALWAAHAGPELPAPSVDFTSRIVAAVFAGERPTPGYEVEIVDSQVDGVGLSLTVKERSPLPGAIAAQILVSPFHIVSLPRHDGRVTFIDAARESPRPATVAVVQPTGATPSSTGLDPTTAAALAYLAGPFSGLFILLVERSSRFVRFHAWQAIIGLGGLWAIGFAFYTLAFVTLFLSAAVFRAMLWLAAITWMVWVVVWAICMAKAISGALWTLPIAGGYAARRAGAIVEGAERRERL
jgi:uncharacterized membrane protein